MQIEKDICKKISNFNLEVPRIVNLYHNEPSPECNSVVCGQVLRSFNRYIEYSVNPEPMIQFAESLCSNSRKSVAKQAKSFLKKHTPAVPKP